MTVYGVLEAVERSGQTTFDLNATPELAHIARELEGLKRAARESRENVPLVSLLEPSPSEKQTHERDCHHRKREPGRIACRGRGRRPELGLVQLFARNEGGAARLRRWPAPPGAAMPRSWPARRRYLIAVSDRAVAEVAAQLPIPAGAAVAHTAGCVPLDALPYERRAVFYPMQTFTRGRRVDFAEIPIFVEASTPALCDELEACARCLSRRVVRSDSARRARIHLCGGLRLQLRQPHVRPRRAHRPRCGPRLRGAQAAHYGDGPQGVRRPVALRRADRPRRARRPATQQRHLDLLGGDENLQEIYKLISKEIWETSRKI